MLLKMKQINLMKIYQNNLKFKNKLHNVLKKVKKNVKILINKKKQRMIWLDGICDINFIFNLNY